MATATPTRSEAGERRFLIRNIGWVGYRALRHILGDHGPRHSYARGSVELMSPLLPHVNFSKLLGRMVEAICEELEIPMRSARSTTLDREDVDRGAEPDESYYIANQHRIADREQIDLEVAPPPDLVIEVEITSGLLHKLEIYSRLGVPELWRFDGETLTVQLLQADGTYAVSERSASFPFLPMDEVARFLHDPGRSDESRWGRRFRAWVREVLLPLHRNPAAPE